jgi:hypothetical protein
MRALGHETPEQSHLATVPISFIAVCNGMRSELHTS